jgi:hypothetical protein
MFSFTPLLLLLATVASSSSVAPDATPQQLVDAADAATTPTNHHLRGGRELDTGEDDTKICYQTTGAYEDYFCEFFKTLSDGTELQLKHKILQDTDDDDEVPWCIGWSTLKGECNSCFAPGESGYPCAVGIGEITYDCSNLSTDLCAKVDCAGNCVNVETGPGAVECFSGTTLVTVKNKGTISMHQLRLGDEVLTDPTSGTYEPVYTFGHRDESNDAKYLQLLPSMLELSEDHMVFVESGEAVPAAIIKVGDILSSGQEVTGIKTVNRKGAYAPFTPSGIIIVNGVQASNYIALQKTSATMMIGPFSTGLSFHWLAHASQMPQRTWCSMTTACTEDTYNENGISKWVEFQHRAFNWLLHPSNAKIMALLVIPLLLVLGALGAMDYLMSSASSYPVAAALTLVALLVSRRATSKPKMM